MDLPVSVQNGDEIKLLKGMYAIYSGIFEKKCPEEKIDALMRF